MPRALLPLCLSLATTTTKLASCAVPSLPPLTASFLPAQALLVYGSLPPTAGRLALRLATEGEGAVAEVRVNERGEAEEGKRGGTLEGLGHVVSQNPSPLLS